MNSVPTTTKTTKPDHPAKFSREVLDVIESMLHAYLPLGGTVLDPFGGVGGIHKLNGPWETYAVEIEPEWAAQSAELGHTWCGDFFEFQPWALDGWPTEFDAVVTSPTYGNRMADHHDARDGSKRITYKHKLGRDLTDNNSGAMQWGAEYKAFHMFAWRRVYRAMLTPGGLFVLNVKDHVRNKRIVPVVDWHRERAERTGFVLLQDEYVETPGMRFGANHTLRVDGEHVMLFRRP